MLDLTTPSVSRWFDRHDFTTSALTGLLLLLLTVLLVNRVVRIRQLRDRTQVIAAQAALIAAQAHRAQQAMRSATNGDGDRDVASDEVRTYLTMLLISAPVLIDARESRTFLERAQWLAALLSSALRASGDGSISAELEQRLHDATERLHEAVAPLLARLDPTQREAIRRAQAAGEGADDTPTA